jgi:hypothetical protein
LDWDTAVPSCAWADASTVVTVTEGLSSTRPEDVDLDALAAEVSAMRDDVRVS